jgi:hypothetical protein
LFFNRMAAAIPAIPAPIIMALFIKRGVLNF